MALIGNKAGEDSAKLYEGKHVHADQCEMIEIIEELIDEEEEGERKWKKVNAPKRLLRTTGVQTSAPVVTPAAADAVRLWRTIARTTEPHSELNH